VREPKDEGQNDENLPEYVAVAHSRSVYS
jgi:hypothetical protein